METMANRSGGYPPCVMPRENIHCRLHAEQKIVREREDQALERVPKTDGSDGISLLSGIVCEGTAGFQPSLRKRKIHCETHQADIGARRTEAAIPAGICELRGLYGRECVR